VDLFQVFHSAVRIFTKADGSKLNSAPFPFRITKHRIGLRKTPAVIGDLMWKPFDVRFQSMLEQMKSRRESILYDLLIWNSKTSAEERQRAAEERQNASTERERVKEECMESAEERQLAQEERRLMAEERGQNAEARQRTACLLGEVQKAKRLLEQDRLGKGMQSGLHIQDLFTGVCREDSVENPSLVVASEFFRHEGTMR
jgi:hypothetical protein